MIDREIQVNSDHTFTVTYYDHGVAIDYNGYNPQPSFAVYDNAGTVVFTAECTIIDYALQCFFPATDNDTVGKNYKLIITHGDDIDDTYLFDVCKIAIRNTVSDEDLFLYAEDLRTKIFDRQSRTTESGAENMLIDAALESEYRDMKGGRLIILSDGEEHEAMVTDYSRSGGTVYFNPPYDTVVPDDTQYIIRASYAAQIERAFETVRTDIRGKVPIMSGYVSSLAVRDMITFCALWVVCQTHVETEGDRWDLKAKRFEAEYMKLTAKLNEPFDTDEDGNVSDSENAERPMFSRIDVSR